MVSVGFLTGFLSTMQEMGRRNSEQWNQISQLMLRREEAKNRQKILDRQINHMDMEMAKAEVDREETTFRRSIEPLIFQRQAILDQKGPLTPDQQAQVQSLTQAITGKYANRRAVGMQGTESPHVGGSKQPAPSGGTQGEEAQSPAVQGMMESDARRAQTRVDDVTRQLRDAGVPDALIQAGPSGSLQINLDTKEEVEAFNSSALGRAASSLGVPVTSKQSQAEAKFRQQALDAETSTMMEKREDEALGNVVGMLNRSFQGTELEDAVLFEEKPPQNVTVKTEDGISQRVEVPGGVMMKVAGNDLSEILTPTETGILGTEFNTKVAQFSDAMSEIADTLEGNPEAARGFLRMLEKQEFPAQLRGFENRLLKEGAAKKVGKDFVLNPFIDSEIAWDVRRSTSSLSSALKRIADAGGVDSRDLFNVRPPKMAETLDLFEESVDAMGLPKVEYDAPPAVKSQLLDMLKSLDNRLPQPVGAEGVTVEGLGAVLRTVASEIKQTARDPQYGMTPGYEMVLERLMTRVAPEEREAVRAALLGPKKTESKYKDPLMRWYMERKGK